MMTYVIINGLLVSVVSIMTLEFDDALWLTQGARNLLP